MKNSISIFLIIAVVVILLSCEDSNNPSDPKTQSKQYDSVVIGTQVWMKRNLDVTHYSNGDSIPEVRDSASWANLTTGAWCYYNNDPANDSIYGKLYNWYAVNDPRGLAPNGWHVASDEEWKIMEMYLGMSRSDVDSIEYRGTNEGSKLAGRADLWKNGSLLQNQSFGSSGFDALPGGNRRQTSFFANKGNFTIWWTSTEDSPKNAISRSLDCYSTGVGWDNNEKKRGCSVRCVKN